MRIWREYTLGLVINRQCAEFWTDDEVSEMLHSVAATHRLPWE